MSHFRNWFEAALVAAFLLVLSAVLEGPDEVQAAADMEAAHADAIVTAREMYRDDLAAAKVCRSMYAERAVVHQLQSGEILCRRMEDAI